jgi:hypothetical protein
MNSSAVPESDCERKKSGSLAMLAARFLVSGPLNACLWFAGEAVHQTLCGTVGAAWQNGEHAANAVIAQLDHPRVSFRWRLTKRTSRHARSMSAFGGKADLASQRQLLDQDFA